MRLAIGMSDGLSKLAAHVLLKPILDTPELRLVCHDGSVNELMAELALHKLDVVLTDREVRSGTTLRVFSHMLFESGTIVAGAPALA